MKVGAYEVGQELGRGGMGVVRVARSPTGERFAIKLLPPFAGPEQRDRFAREQRLFAALGTAEGFVPYVDAGISPSGPYLVMPLLEGGTLRDRLRRGPFELEEALALGRKLTRALATAHARGIVHRDLKPENVLFDEQDRPFVADLGLAKHFSREVPGGSQSVSLSKTGELRGTVGYMAPEQARDSAKVGPKADVYALGAILYECLAGQGPFAGCSGLETLARAERGEIEPLRRLRPGVPVWLETVVLRALAPDPMQRYVNAAALLRALEPPAAAAVPVRSRWVTAAVITGFAALLLMVGGIVLAARSGPRAAPSPEDPISLRTPPPRSPVRPPPAAVDPDARNVSVASLVSEATDLDSLTRPATYTLHRVSGTSLPGPIATASGPGAIVELWSAPRRAGTHAPDLSVRIDGHGRLPTLAYDLTSSLPFVPIPYAEGMEVVGGGRGELELAYRDYPPGTTVVSADAAHLDEAFTAARMHERPTRHPGAHASRELDERRPLVLDGPGTVESLELRVAAESIARLRECTLRIECDDELCVLAPVADFFAVSPSSSPRFETAPLDASVAAHELTMTCRFPMPFERRARIALESPGPSIRGRAEVRAQAAGPLRFHAAWRANPAVAAGGGGAWRLAQVRGRGRYVGTTLAVRNPARRSWASSSIRMHVDDDLSPSRDAPSARAYFRHPDPPGELASPFAALTRAPDPRDEAEGLWMQSRFHVLDSVPFDRSLSVDLELQDTAPVALGFGAVAYWYAEPASGAGAPPPSIDDAARDLDHPGPLLLEGEALHVMGVPPGDVDRQIMDPFGPDWSGNAQLWWGHAAVGDRLALAIPSPIAGPANLVIGFTKAPNFGTFALALEGETLGTVDLYAREVSRAPEVVFPVTLRVGENRLEVRLTGKNAAASDGFELGLDEVRIQPVP